MRENERDTHDDETEDNYEEDVKKKGEGREQMLSAVILSESGEEKA